MSLIPITERDFGVKIDLKYATADNFTGVPVYKKDAGCYLHTAAADALRKAVNIAAPLGLSFIVYDAFRPSEAQWKLWNHTPDPGFLADPAKGSPHSRGVAIDLSLMDKTGQVLDMGTAFDAFTPQSHHGRTDIPIHAQQNRLLLMGIMTTAGWDFYRNEWWHYQLFNSRDYTLLSDKDTGASMMA